MPACVSRVFEPNKSSFKYKEVAISREIASLNVSETHQILD